LDSSGAKDWNDLLKLAKAGDREGQRQFFTHLAVTLGPIVQYRLRGWQHQDQEDILQETLITVAQKLDGVRSNPHKYAAAVLRNKIGDALRARSGRIRLSLDSAPEPGTGSIRQEIEQILSQTGGGKDALTQVELGERIEGIKSAIKRLSSFCQAFFIGVMEQRETGELWELFRASNPGLKRNAFRKRIFDCRMKLKSILQEQG
jgi:DNA-directed RNA polymerase specialized sigma24 family protein